MDLLQLVASRGRERYRVPAPFYLPLFCPFVVSVAHQSDLAQTHPPLPLCYQSPPLRPGKESSSLSVLIDFETGCSLSFAKVRPHPPPPRSDLARLFAPVGHFLLSSASAATFLPDLDLACNDDRLNCSLVVPFRPLSPPHRLPRRPTPVQEPSQPKPSPSSGLLPFLFFPLSWSFFASTSVFQHSSAPDMAFGDFEWLCMFPLLCFEHSAFLRTCRLTPLPFSCSLQVAMYRPTRRATSSSGSYCTPLRRLSLPSSRRSLRPPSRTRAWIKRSRPLQSGWIQCVVLGGWESDMGLEGRRTLFCARSPSRWSSLWCGPPGGGTRRSGGWSLFCS